MKVFRDRIPKTLPPVAPSPSPAAGAGERRKVIQDLSEREGDFAKMYKLKGKVMESSHLGMDVHYATRLSDEEEVVVKVREKETSFKTEREQLDWRRTTEVQLNLPTTEKICEFLEVLETRERYYVVMEKVEGKDLFEQIAEERIVHLDAREIIRQVLLALVDFHGCGRIHKDLKLENIMVDMNSSKRHANPARRSLMPDGTPPSPDSGVTTAAAATGPVVTKLIDFDMADCYGPGPSMTKDVLGTDGYIAPEAYSGQYSPASDVYCVGVMMYKLLTSRFPWPSHMFDDEQGENYVGSPAMVRIQERLKSEQIDYTRPPLDRCPGAADLCSQMLAYNPSDRPTAHAALKHAWFAQRPEELQSPRRAAAARQPSGPPP